MSSTIGFSSPAGIAAAIGLVDSSMSRPPQGGRWLALPTAKYNPIMSWASGMVAYSEAGPAWLENCEMAQAIVAVHHRGADVIVHHADVGPDVEAARLDPPCILRQPGHAMPVRTLQIGFCHQRGDGRGILVRQAQIRQRFPDEGL